MRRGSIRPPSQVFEYGMISKAFDTKSNGGEGTPPSAILQYTTGDKAVASVVTATTFSLYVRYLHCLSRRPRRRTNIRTRRKKRRLTLGTQHRHNVKLCQSMSVLSNTLPLPAVVASPALGREGATNRSQKEASPRWVHWRYLQRLTVLKPSNP